MYMGKEEPVMFDHQEELDQYLENIEALIKNKQYARLRDLFLPMEPADIALLLEEAGEEEMPLLYRLLPKELRRRCSWSWNPTARRCSSTAFPTPS